MNEGQPVFGFLTPADAQTTAFGKPTEGALHDPAAGRELRFTRDGALLKDRFTTPPTMFDMSNITFLLDKLMDIRKIIAFIKTHVLFDCLRLRTWDDNRDDDFIDQPFVMDIGSSNVGGQGCATSIHQKMNFAAALGSVYRTFTRIIAAQWGWTRFAINGLPGPLDTSLSFVKLRKFTHQTLKNAALLPFLKTVMDRRTTYPEPVPMYRFPLTTCPQHIPYPVYYATIVGAFSPWPLALWLFRQYPLQPSPQRSWYLKIIDILWFFAMILVQDVSVLIAVWRLQSKRDTSSFSILSSIYG